MDVPVAGRLARPAWVNLRSLLGALLFLLAFAGGQKILNEAKETTTVWTAARDLAVNTPLRRDDFKLAEVRLPDFLRSRYATGARDLAGRYLARPVAAGELVPTGWLVSAATRERGSAISIPVTPDHAVGGYLGPGDRIDVLATFDAADVRARTETILAAAEVLDVVRAGGLVTGDEAPVGVLVAVSPPEASRLAFAIRSAEIDIVRLDGGRGSRAGTMIRAEEFE